MSEQIKHKLYKNRVYVELSHKALFHHPVVRFTSKIENAEITISSTSNKHIAVEVVGRKSVSTLKSIFFEIDSLFFIYWGSFPEIEKFQVNGEDINTSKLIGKYESWDYFEKCSYMLCEIDNNSINENVIVRLRQIRKTPLFSLQYLVSKQYSQIIINHRVALLLQIIDGLVSASQRNSVTQELSMLYGPNKLGNYKKAVYYLCKQHFFYYNRRFHCELLKRLGKSHKGFLDAITDTRHWYSHYLGENERDKRIKGGGEMWYYFEILYYAVRLMILTQLGVTADEQNISEFYKTIHDWILKTKYDRDDSYKSKTYLMDKAIREFTAKLPVN